MNYLADVSISGDWLIALIGTVVLSLGGVALQFWRAGKIAGKRESVTITEPVPTFPFRKVLSPPTFEQHNALEKRVDRIDQRVDQLENNLSKQFRDLMIAGQERELRLAELIREEVRSIHVRVDAIIQSKP